MSFAARPTDDGAYAVMVMPGQSEAKLINAIAQADGVLVRQSRYAWLAIAAPSANQTPSQFRADLRSAGIHFVLHPALLAGCFVESDVVALKAPIAAQLGLISS